jgi:hypothetical protein
MRTVQRLDNFPVDASRRNPKFAPDFLPLKRGSFQEQKLALLFPEFI